MYVPFSPCAGQLWPTKEMVSPFPLVPNPSPTIVNVTSLNGISKWQHLLSPPPTLLEIECKVRSVILPLYNHFYDLYQPPEASLAVTARRVIFLDRHLLSTSLPQPALTASSQGCPATCAAHLTLKSAFTHSCHKVLQSSHAYYVLDGREKI